MSKKDNKKYIKKEIEIEATKKDDMNKNKGKVEKEDGDDMACGKKGKKGKKGKR